MCIGCHWANFRDYAQIASTSNGGGLTRRQALRRGARFAATAAVASSAAPSFIAEAVAASGPGADIIFRNGPVYTVNADTPWARAVAVKGKRIVYVGEEGGVKSFLGSNTRVVDLKGKMLLPALSRATFIPWSARP